APGWTLDLLNSTTKRRFFKTHANVKDLPAGSAPGVKVIYIARNPKDVCVSLFHHAKNKPDFEFTGKFDDMLHLFAEGRAENSSWFDHVLEWYEASKVDPEHVLFLCYEDMLANPSASVGKIADFVGIAYDDQLLEKVCESSSISSMKGNKKVAQVVGFSHIRKGGAGGWRDVFTVRQSEAFDALYKASMEGTGLTMNFGEGVVM
ncbi:unnamed protein product, partial [Choristocarpus tenellus]